MYMGGREREREREYMKFSLNTSYTIWSTEYENRKIKSC